MFSLYYYGTLFGHLLSTWVTCCLKYCRMLHHRRLHLFPACISGHQTGHDCIHSWSRKTSRSCCPVFVSKNHSTLLQLFVSSNYWVFEGWCLTQCLLQTIHLPNVSISYSKMKIMSKYQKRHPLPKCSPFNIETNFTSLSPTFPNMFDCGWKWWKHINLLRPYIPWKWTFT